MKFARVDESCERTTKTWDGGETDNSGTESVVGRNNILYLLIGRDQRPTERIIK